MQSQLGDISLIKTWVIASIKKASVHNLQMATSERPSIRGAQYYMALNYICCLIITRLVQFISNGGACEFMCSYIYF